MIMVMMMMIFYTVLSLNNKYQTCDIFLQIRFERKQICVNDSRQLLYALEIFGIRHSPMSDAASHQNVFKAKYI